MSVPAWWGVGPDDVPAYDGPPQTPRRRSVPSAPAPDALCGAVYANLGSDDPATVDCLTKAVKLHVGQLSDGRLLNLHMAIVGMLTAKHGRRSTTSLQAWREALAAVDERLACSAAA